MLECGVGTGNTFKLYQPEDIKSYIGIDWSSGMLEQAFATVDEASREEPCGIAKLIKSH